MRASPRGSFSKRLGSIRRYVAQFLRSLYVEYRSKGIDVQCQILRVVRQRRPWLRRCRWSCSGWQRRWTPGHRASGAIRAWHAQAAGSCVRSVNLWNLCKQEVFTAKPQQCVFSKLVVEDTNNVSSRILLLRIHTMCLLSSQHKTVYSSLRRRLISTASSSTVLANAVQLLSCLNKDSADQGDMLNLFIAYVDEFPEVAEGHAIVEMARQKLDLLIIEYQKQLGMRNLEFKTVAGTTYLIEVKSVTKKSTRLHATREQEHEGL